MIKILIVEDDKTVSNIYRDRLCREGYQVEVGLDAETGLELLHSFRPDAVILDLLLPKMTGVELIKKIRAESATAHVPVIVFSNAYLPNLLHEAWKAGATRCLAKANCTAKQLTDTLRELLSGSGAPGDGASSRPAPGGG